MNSVWAYQKAWSGIIRKGLRSTRGCHLNFTVSDDKTLNASRKEKIAPGIINSADWEFQLSPFYFKYLMAPKLESLVATGSTEWQFSLPKLIYWEGFEKVRIAKLRKVVLKFSDQKTYNGTSMYYGWGQSWMRTKEKKMS